MVIKGNVHVHVADNLRMINRFLDFIYVDINSILAVIYLNKLQNLINRLV